MKIFSVSNVKKETLEQRRKRVEEILRRLKRAYPKAKMALKYGSNIQLLAAVILSAQCTDKKVNEVTEKLFKKYYTVDDFANANLKTFEKEIKSTGFYRAKAKSIITSAKIIKNDFGGKLPKTMAEMLKLRGVARKTANIVLGNAYGVVEGIAVDTHVRQFANYCALSFERDPKKIEQDLMRLFPKKDWLSITYKIQTFNREMKNKTNRAHAKIHLLDVCPASPV